MIQTSPHPVQTVIAWRWATLIYAIALIIGVAVYLKTPQRSVSQHYELAAVHWLQGEELYAESSVTGHGFIYLPQSAILHIPFALCSQLTGWSAAGDVVWRIVSWSLLAYSTIRFAKLSQLPSSQTQWRVALVTSLLGLSCLRIGQSTILLTALMLLAVVDWSAQRWTRTAIWIGLAIAVKPLAIVMALLLGATSAPMRVRLIVTMIVVAVFPFLCQRPEYVVQQYQACRVMLQTAANLGNESNWAQLFGMLDFLGIALPGTLQSVIRVCAAVLTLGLVWRGMQVQREPWPAIWLMTWSTIYLMLFNPRTENSTYCMFGPVLGLWLAESVVRTGYSVWTIILTVLTITTATSHELGKFLTPADKTAIWLAPLSCCIVTGYLLQRFFQLHRQPALVPGTVT